MKDLNTYHLKLTALSPIHIGTGESYEPTNFVIDAGTLYEFDEVLFYKSLSDVDKKALNNKMSNWLQIIEFYKTKKEEAKKISFFECQVSKEVQKKYDAKNPNQLQINRTFKNPNTQRAVIAGSGIKGMLDTVLGIYPQKVKDNDVRQKLIISDALLLDGGVEIGFSYRKHRVKDEGGKIPQMVEVVKPKSTFVLSIKTEHSFKQLQEFMKKYHADRKNSIYKEDEKSFIARIGKYSGMEYMVDDGKNLQNSYGKPLATYSIYESNTLKDEMFGWVKFELIDKEAYQDSLTGIQNQEKNYYQARDEKQAEVLRKIQKIEDNSKAVKRQKKEDDEKEKQAKINADTKRKAKLEAMSPIEKIIDNYDNDIPKVINAIKANEIENLEEIKVELAQKLKELMQKNPKEWERAKQKALKRKEYIETLLG